MQSPSHPEERLLVRALAACLGAHPALGSVAEDASDGYMFQFSAECWTVSLARRRFLVRHLPGAWQVRNREGHETAASELTASFLSVQDERHRIATAHGLRAMPGAALDPAGIMIDRASKEILLHRGERLASLVEAERECPIHGVWEDMPPETHRHRSAGDTSYMITDGGDAPRLTCVIRMGSRPSATLFGTAFRLLSRLPETLIAAAAGRKLGELVATGTASLDGRRILGAAAYAGIVEFNLEDDWVTIGDATRTWAVD